MLGQTCAGTGGVELPGFGCVYDPEGDALLDNTFTHNGYFGNPTNADFGQIVINAGRARELLRRQHRPGGSAPADLEQIQPTCDGIARRRQHRRGAARPGAVRHRLRTCPAGAHYPQLTASSCTRSRPACRTMPNPCAGVPANPWCPKGQPV